MARVTRLLDQFDCLVRPPIEGLHQWRNQKFQWGWRFSASSLFPYHAFPHFVSSFFLPMLPLPSPSLFPSFLLEVGPPKIQLWCLGARIGVWGGAPAEIEFSAFKFFKMRSGGNNFSYFPENRLTKLLNLVHFKRMLKFCLEDWGKPGPAGPPCLRHLSTVRRQVSGHWRQTNPQTRVWKIPSGFEFRKRDVIMLMMSLHCRPQSQQLSCVVGVNRP